MGRRSAPYTVYSDPRTGLAWINATIGGKRARHSLGLAYEEPRSPGHAKRVREAAAQAYAEILSGRSLVPAGRVRTIATLAELVEDWLVEDAVNYPASAKLTITHASHIERFAEANRGRKTPLERLAADAGPTDYVLWRLRQVLKETVIKEVSTLFRFYAWAVKREHLDSMPPRPAWPKKAIGVRAGTQRAAPVDATHKEMLAILAALPEWSAKGRSKAQPIPVRDLGYLAYFTGLRPSTIARLSCPEHFAKGADRLFIPPEIDKGRNKARWVPLTKTVQEILNRHAKPGIMFGKHDLRVQWKRAAAKVLPPEKAKNFSVYDFRHGAGRLMVEASGGNLLGVAHMLGHKHLTTTNRYLAPAEHHGLSVTDALNKISSAKRSARKTKKNAPRKK